MNDFASRLIARALGTGSSIRPRVLPLFAAAEVPNAAAGFFEENAFEPAPSRQETPRNARPATVPRFHEEQAEPPIGRPVTHPPRRPLAASREPAPVTGTGPASMVDSPGRKLSTVIDQDVPAAQEPPPMRLPPPALRKADTEGTPRQTEAVVLASDAPPWAPGSEPPVAQARSEQAASAPVGLPPERIQPHEDASPNRRYLGELAKPSDLLPNNLPEPRPASPSAPAERLPSAAADEPPSVVVEIGSIEFRSPPAAPQPRVAARRLPSLALADYLARRR
jgi:hypothetical protein